MQIETRRGTGELYISRQPSLKLIHLPIPPTMEDNPFLSDELEKAEGVEESKKPLRCSHTGSSIVPALLAVVAPLLVTSLLLNIYLFRRSNTSEVFAYGSQIGKNPIGKRVSRTY